MSKYLEDIVEERTALAATVEGFTTLATTEARDLTDAELAEVAKINGRAAELDKALSLYGESQQANSRYAELMGRIQTRNAVRVEQAVSKSWGEQFIASNEFRSYPGRGSSGVLEFGIEGRAGEVTTTNAVVGSSISSAFEGNPNFPILSVVNNEPVSTGSVDWVHVGPASDAVITAETVAKTQATLVFTPKSDTLETLAHWTPITRQAAEDNVRLASIIENKLKQGVYRKMQKQCIAALVAETLPTATGTDMLTAIRNGVAVVEGTDEYIANTVALNPVDYAATDIAALAAAGGMSTINSQGQYWDLNVVSSAAVTLGTAYVGDFKALSNFYRNAVAIYMTDAHSDFFIKNQLVILAEIRASAAVTETLAFAECTVAP